MQVSTPIRCEMRWPITVSQEQITSEQDQSEFLILF